MSDEPAELTETQLHELHELLRSHLAEAQAATERSSQDVKPVSLDEPIGRLSRMDAMQQRAMAQASRHKMQLRKAQLQGALKAYQDGVYGDCRSCGETVGYQRLRSRPEAPFCIECQSERETRN